jgi:hypothetical protein
MQVPWWARYNKQTGSRSLKVVRKLYNQVFFFTFHSPLTNQHFPSFKRIIFKMEHLNPDEKANKIRGLHA